MRKQLFSNISLLLVFLVLSGCRTYGDYGTEQASYDRIAAINTQFSQDLERAKGDLEVLKRAAGSDSDLKMALMQYESLLAQHEEISARHKEMALNLTVKTGLMGKLSTSYRDLNRALGSITIEQLSMHKNYSRFAASLLEDDSYKAIAGPESASRYHIAPPFYEEIRYALAKVSVSDALDLRAGS
ncbi:MAG: hypothetical protein AB8G77_13700 [Rhodothermales bacterium]